MNFQLTETDFAASVEQFVERIEEGALVVPAAPRTGTPLAPTDPSDDHVLFAAITGKADILCTLDRDFSDPAVVAYCEERGIRVMSDIELLALLREQHARKAA